MYCNYLITADRFRTICSNVLFILCCILYTYFREISLLYFFTLVSIFRPKKLGISNQHEISLNKLFIRIRINYVYVYNNLLKYPKILSDDRYIMIDRYINRAHN